MKIGFIGAGKAGTCIAVYLKSKGYEITGFHSRTCESSVNSSVIADTKAYISLERLTEDSDVLVISTPDSEIRKTARQIFSYKPDGKIFIHLSGSLSADTMDIKRSNNHTFISFHPPYPFASKTNADLTGITFALEGYGGQYDEMKRSLSNHGIDFFEISKEQKPIYHMALSVMSNYVITLLGIGNDMLNHIGIDSLKPFEKILTQNIKNAIDAEDIKDALTGPISRGDALTVKKHIEEIEKNFDKSVLAIYKMLGLKTIDYAKLSKKNTNKIKEAITWKRKSQQNHLNS